MLLKGINSPKTSSVGRLFDAVASILGVRQYCRFEGQAAMEMEFLTSGCTTEESYPFSLSDGSRIIRGAKRSREAIFPCNFSRFD